MTSQAGFDHNVISTCQNFIEKVEQYYIFYIVTYLLVVSMGRGNATNHVTSNDVCLRVKISSKIEQYYIYLLTYLLCYLL